MWSKLKLSTFFCIEEKTSRMDEIELGPHGYHHLLNKKESSKSVHPIESFERTHYNW